MFKFVDIISFYPITPYHHQNANVFIFFPPSLATIFLLCLSINSMCFGLNLTQLNLIKRYSLQQPMDPTQKMVKVLYLNEQRTWQQYLQATLKLQTRQEDGLDLLLVLTQSPPSHLLTVLPLIQIYREKEKTIHIGLEMISHVQRLEDLIIAFKLEQWGRVLALSFRDEDYCSMILDQIELEIASSNQLPCHPEELIKYISKEIHCVDLAFENTNVAHQFFALVESPTLGEDEEKDVFRIVKTVFMQSRKDTLQIFLKEQYFLTVLKCLSYNYQFGDRRIDYVKQYERICKCRNILDLQEKHIIEHYRDIMKTRYLIDYPTSMFIEMNAQVVLNEIIRQHTIAIIKILIQHPNFLTKYKQLALIDPVIFIQLFSELWEMFKLVIEELSTAELKSKFHALFLKENLLQITFSCVLKVAEENKAEMRLYQKFLQSLNPFLSFKWHQSQDYLLSFCKNNQAHLLKILLAIMHLDDYNTKTVVLLFARYLLEVTQNRKSMKQSFISYVFTEFVGKIDPYFTTAEELEIHIAFLMRCYRVDHHRTRRCITEGAIVSKLEQKAQNKYILILIVRFLRSLLELRFEEIFIYLQRHSLFSFLREAYYRTKKYSPRGILYSMFLGLIKDIEKSDNRSGVRYVFDIMCPNNSKT